jgi:hypothetical protein
MGKLKFGYGTLFGADCGDLRITVSLSDMIRFVKNDILKIIRPLV